MSYTPTVWKTGDIVSSQRLNKLEEGVRDAYEVMVINIVTEDPAQSAKNLLRASRGGSTVFLDKTWQQIFDALIAGKLCAIKRTGEGVASFAPVTTASTEEGSYKILSGAGNFKTSSADGYPSA